jgi:hypothetical protein
MARKIIESAIAAAVTLGGIFGLIVDAPDVFDLALSILATPFVWLGQMSTAIGYWLLILAGMASLAWIHFGDRVSLPLRSMPTTLRHGSNKDNYGISRIRLFCDAALDPATDALQHLSSERFAQLEMTNPDIALIIADHRDIAIRLTKNPRDRLHSSFKKSEPANCN